MKECQRLGRCCLFTGDKVRFAQCRSWEVANAHKIRMETGNRGGGGVECQWLDRHDAKGVPENDQPSLKA